MRIMHFAGGGDVGGAKTHILSLGCQLAQNNDFCLVSFRPGPFADEARKLGLRVEIAPRPWNLLACLRQALKLVDEFKPDVIHCHGAKANMLGAMVKKLRHRPLVTTVHSDPKLDYLGSPLRQLFFGGLNMLALRKMDSYMAVARRVEQNLIEHGVDPQKIFVLYNSLDFSAAPQENPHHDDGVSDVVVGIAARLTPIKDIPTLLRAFAKAQAQNPRLKLKIAGVGEEEDHLRTLARELHLEKKVDFVGWISDMAGFFAGVDINVLSSLSEGFPYSLLEGAYEHCAVISTAVGGIPELIDDGETGLIFQPGDVDRLAELLYTLSTDTELRTRLAENLFRRAQADFSLEHMRQVQEKSYSQVLRRYRQSGRSGVLICGAYGRGNAGDEAILQAIVSQLRSIDEGLPITVMSRKRLETKLQHHVQVIYTFDLPRFVRSLRKSRLFLNGGGSLIQDVTSSRSLYFYLFTLRMAHLCGCKVQMYGCGIGPIVRRFNRRPVRRILNRNVDVITLRDSVSRDFLTELGVSVPRISLASDPTASIKQAAPTVLRAALAREQVPEDVPKIAICLRNWADFRQPQLIAQAADYAWQRYGFLPVFIPVELPHDVMAAEKTAALMSAPSVICRQRYTVEELIAMLGSMRMVIGMRLHSLIFATLGQAPVIGLSYDIKVESFIRDIGSSACLPIKDMGWPSLKALMDDIAAAGCPRTGQGRQKLQDGMSVNVEAARKLLESWPKA